jgi:L-asparaginase
MTADILFCMMGGTIDSFYDGRIDTVRPHAHSIIPGFIQSLNLHSTARFVQVAMKDSRELTDDDRARLLQTIEAADERKIIVTHGTNTMPITAKYLRQNLKKRFARIVFTGSLIPISGMTNSDAPFNLGFAMAAANILPPDVYVCMNGRIFNAEEVMEIKGEGIFRSVHDK